MKGLLLSFAAIPSNLWRLQRVYEVVSGDRELPSALPWVPEDQESREVKQRACVEATRTVCAEATHMACFEATQPEYVEVTRTAYDEAMLQEYRDAKHPKHNETTHAAKLLVCFAAMVCSAVQCLSAKLH